MTCALTKSSGSPLAGICFYGVRPDIGLIPNSGSYAEDGSLGRAHTGASILTEGINACRPCAPGKVDLDGNPATPCTTCGAGNQVDTLSIYHATFMKTGCMARATPSSACCDWWPGWAAPHGGAPAMYGDMRS